MNSPPTMSFHIMHVNAVANRATHRGEPGLFSERVDRIRRSVASVWCDDAGGVGDARESTARSRQKCEEPAVGQRAATTRGEVYDMLRDLRLKCETASLKLNTISDDLYPQISNPNLREWEYTTTPRARRRPQFGDQVELSRHVTSLYRHLHTQAEINQSRINTLQSKMKILYMQTKAEMIKQQQDPRVGL
uniref:Uncharacterized protein n=1 Tax=Neospora caninum (strain Liverpool) TaxID=572307 RepID=A0A0F7UHZ2_NEOCL|nr:TPA: hypothetical protein BN1204_053140 [Neospora caninum Liverpool]